MKMTPASSRARWIASRFATDFCPLARAADGSGTRRFRDCRASQEVKRLSGDRQIGKPFPISELLRNGHMILRLIPKTAPT